jgi:indolepyruvate ferredoxin oxidoreductase beta subunit
VADLKTRPERYESLRRRAQAKPNEPLIVTEFLKPGLEEFGGMLPPSLAKPLLAWAESRKLLDRARLGLQIRTSSIFGFLQLWLLALISFKVS